MKIFLIGFMGAGKSFWGQQLAQKIGVPFFDLDEQVINAEEKDINQIFQEHGEEYFRIKEKEVLHILSESHESFVMACGGGTPCYFNNIEYMNRNGISVWINTPVPLLVDRLLKEKEHRPLLKDLSETELKNFIAKKLADRRIYYEQASLFLEEENITLDHFIKKIFHA